VKKGFVALLTGLGLAGAVAIWVEALQKRGLVRVCETRTERQSRRHAALLDLNRITDEQLLGLGVTRTDFRERILENRPYRNKMELLSRMVVPQNVYDRLKNRVRISGTEEGVKFAG